jgi:hypothetical protein
MVSWYVPTALQFPRAPHDIATKDKPGDVLASDGSAAVIPVSHVPLNSASSSGCLTNSESYVPPALQLPGVVQETELNVTPGSAPAFDGKDASTPAPHVPLVSPTSRPC